MVFSFFKKKDQADDQPKQPAIKLPAGQQPSTAETQAAPSEETIFGDSMSFAPAKIEVFEVSEGLEPIVEEAAMLFANDQLDAAIAVLTNYLAGHPTQSSDEPWLMLFELYQQQSAKREYDDLAMQFVLKFERTAPVWRTDGVQSPVNQSAMQTRSNYFSFVAAIEAGSGKISDFAAVAAKGEKIRLDFSKFESMHPAASSALQQALQACRKAKTPVQFVAGPRLTGWLHAQIEMMRREDAETPYWLLLLEIYQAIGQQETFENLAVDYAVTYEVSPPSWETPILIASEADDEIEEEVIDVADTAAGDVCFIRGVITDQVQEQLQKLSQFADHHNTVHIDVTELDRIDFVSAGNLLNILVGFATQGKPVIFDGVNALICPLFRIMGIGDVATVNKRK